MDKKVKVSFVLISILILTALSFLFLLRWKQRLEEDLRGSCYLGDSLYEEGKYEEAIEQFKEIIKRHPKDKEAISAYYKIGLSLIKLARHEEAKSFFQRILDEFPESPDIEQAYLELGRTEERQGNLEKASAYYQKIVTEFPQADVVDQALLGLGRVYGEKGRWKEARECFQRAVDDFPEGSASASAKEALGNLNIRLLFSPTLTEDSLVYEVKDGDSLHSIAIKYRTTVALIMKANNLRSPLIRLGKTLKITPGNFHILISKSKNALTLYLNDKLVKVYPVGTGIEDYYTPAGDFPITNKEKEPSWRGLPYGHPENILGSRWMAISKGGYGIHGTTQPETVGKHSSQGCIRMFNEDVEELYELVTIGTTVTIEN